MLFIYSLEKHEFIILVTIVLILAGLVYTFAVRSRKSYTCPECGEKFKVEHMDTARCGMCGALVNQDKEE